MEECLRCYMIRYYSIFNNIFFMTEFNSWFRKKKKTPAWHKAGNFYFRQYTLHYSKFITRMGTKYSYLFLHSQKGRRNQAPAFLLYSMKPWGWKALQGESPGPSFVRVELSLHSWLCCNHHFLVCKIKIKESEYRLVSNLMVQLWIEYSPIPQLWPPKYF